MPVHKCISHMHHQHQREQLERCGLLICCKCQHGHAIAPHLMCAHSAGHHATALSARHALRLAEMSGPPRAVARAALRFIDTAAVVHRTQGLRGFYAGVLPNIMQVSCESLRTSASTAHWAFGSFDAPASAAFLASVRHDVTT